MSHYFFGLGSKLNKGNPSAQGAQLSLTFFFHFNPRSTCSFGLTHWGWVTYICVSKLTITGPDNGLSPGRRQAIIWTNAGILLIRNLGTNFSEILIKINTFSLKKMHLKMSSGRRQPSCLGLNVLSYISIIFRPVIIGSCNSLVPVQPLWHGPI